MSKPRWIALAIVGLAIIAIASIAAWQAPPLKRARERRTRVALLAEVQPVVLKNCILKRFGSVNDGGYLMCDNLSEGVQSAYSYGVGANDEFGCDVARRYRVPVHQYDCFDPARPTCQGGTFMFHEECIGPRAERNGPRVFDTLQNHISHNLDTGKRLIVKIDVEGAECNSLLATPDAVLDQIDQMPMELHGVNEWRSVELVRRLKQTFYLVNLHFNNWACTPESEPLPADVFQMLWVNKRLGVFDESAPTPAPMSALNAPDNPLGPDCQLAAAGK